MQKQIQQVQESLQRVHEDLGDLTRQYQDLLYVKLALDAELATYNKLLSGEEQRLVPQSMSFEPHQIIFEGFLNNIQYEFVFSKLKQNLK